MLYMDFVEKDAHTDVFSGKSNKIADNKNLSIDLSGKPMLTYFAFDIFPIF